MPPRRRPATTQSHPIEPTRTSPRGKKSKPSKEDAAQLSGDGEVNIHGPIGSPLERFHAELVTPWISGEMDTQLFLELASLLDQANLRDVLKKEMDGGIGEGRLDLVWECLMALLVYQMEIGITDEVQLCHLFMQALPSIPWPEEHSRTFEILMRIFCWTCAHLKDDWSGIEGEALARNLFSRIIKEASQLDPLASSTIQSYLKALDHLIGASEGALQFFDREQCLARLKLAKIPQSLLEPIEYTALLGRLDLSLYQQILRKKVRELQRVLFRLVGKNAFSLGSTEMASNPDAILSTLSRLSSSVLKELAKVFDLHYVDDQVLAHHMALYYGKMHIEGRFMEEDWWPGEGQLMPQGGGIAKERQKSWSDYWMRRYHEYKDFFAAEFREELKNAIFDASPVLTRSLHVELTSPTKFCFPLSGFHLTKVGETDLATLLPLEMHAEVFFRQGDPSSSPEIVVGQMIFLVELQSVEKMTRSSCDISIKLDDSFALGKIRAAIVKDISHISQRVDETLQKGGGSIEEADETEGRWTFSKHGAGWVLKLALNPKQFGAQHEQSSFECNAAVLPLAKWQGSRDYLASICQLALEKPRDYEAKRGSLLDHQPKDKIMTKGVSSLISPLSFDWNRAFVCLPTLAACRSTILSSAIALCTYERTMVVCWDEGEARYLFEELLRSRLVNPIDVLLLEEQDRGVERILDQRSELLAKVGRLVSALDLGFSYDASCETADLMFRNIILPQWKAYSNLIKGEAATLTDLVSMFPFTSFFPTTPDELFPQQQTLEQISDRAEHLFATIQHIFMDIAKLRGLELVKSETGQEVFWVKHRARICVTTFSAILRRRDLYQRQKIHFENFICYNIPPEKHQTPLFLYSLANLNPIRFTILGDYSSLPTYPCELIKPKVSHNLSHQILNMANKLAIPGFLSLPSDIATMSLQGHCEIIAVSMDLCTFFEPIPGLFQNLGTAEACKKLLLQDDGKLSKKSTLVICDNPGQKILLQEILSEGSAHSVPIYNVDELIDLYTIYETIILVNTHLDRPGCFVKPNIMASIIRISLHNLYLVIPQSQAPHYDFKTA